MGLNNDVSIKKWKDLDRDRNGVLSESEVQYENSVFVKAGMHYSEFLKANQESLKPDQSPTAEEMNLRKNEAAQIAKHNQEVTATAEALKKQGEANIQKYPQQEMAEKFTTKKIPNPQDPQHPYNIKHIVDMLEHPEKPNNIGKVEEDICGGASLPVGVSTKCNGNDRDKDLAVWANGMGAKFRLNTMSLKSVHKRGSGKLEEELELKYDSKGNLTYVKEGENEFKYESGKLVATKNDKIEASYDSSGTITQLVDREPLRQENGFKKDEAYKFKFDAKGRKVEESDTSPFYEIGCDAKKVHYDYDSSGNLVKTRLLDANNKEIGYEKYNPKTGNITSSFRRIAASLNGDEEKTIQKTYYPTGVIKTSVETEEKTASKTWLKEITTEYNQQGEKVGKKEKWLK